MHIPSKYVIVSAVSDYHWHARQGRMFSQIYNHTKTRCSRAILMPNTVYGSGLLGPIATIVDLDRYYKLTADKLYPCKPLFVIKFMEKTTPTIIEQAYKWGAVAVKLYPYCKERHEQATTNAHDGIPTDWMEMARYSEGIACGGSTGSLKNPNANFLDCIGMIEKLGMVLQLHGEMPNYDTYTGDNTISAVDAFLDFVDYLVYQYPKLKIVLEHISTKKEVQQIQKWSRSNKIAATVTPHHLEYTVNDVVGKPYHYCRPPAQYYFDREALIQFVTSGDPAAICGTDSAAHPKNKKEHVNTCAGVFNAPVFVEYLTELFATRDSLNHINKFLCENGDEFYEQKPSEKTIRLNRQGWVVPQHFSGLRPFLAGKRLEWQI